MFRTATNEKIGKHLTELIDIKFGSTRNFCKALLKLECPEYDEPPKDEIDKMANKLSQIKQGKKGIQLEDLGYFSELLEVSCEEILGAKEHLLSNEYRYTNYNFALSDDKEFWDKFINRDDKIILNADEYGMTVIDYALKFKNYNLLKYLMDKKYIWFVDSRKNDYSTSFGADTSIERKTLKKYDFLKTELRETDKLRTDLAALAIENGDFEMLEMLRARETPDLYFVCGYSNFPIRYRENFNESLVESVSQASPETIDYFTDEFTIKNMDREMRCVFPYTAQLIEKMIKSDNKNVVQALNNAINHNTWALKTLGKMISEAFAFNCKDYSEEAAYNIATERFNMSDDGGFFMYTHLNVNPLGKSKYIWLKTNIVCVNCRSKNPEINRLIAQLNASYEDIKTLNKRKLLRK